MTKVEFAKISGAGNDFVLIDNLEGRLQLPWAEFSRAVCDRHRGVGGDGLIVLHYSQHTAFDMVYFNSDGSAGAMCGNGGRAAARYYALKYSSGSRIVFTSLAERYTADVKEENASLLMSNPRILELSVPLEINGRQLRISIVDSGAPHAVVMATQVLKSALQFGEVNIVTLGRLIRYHERFAPHGTNVDLMIVHDGVISMRTYERGVEAETLACGTGAVACALVANAEAGLNSPIRVETRGGDTLLVQFQLTERGYEGVILQGRACVHFTGVLFFDENLPRSSIRACLVDSSKQMAGRS